MANLFEHLRKGIRDNQDFLMEGPRFRVIEPLMDAHHPMLHNCIPITRDFVFEWKRFDQWDRYLILAGVTHDYATVPWWLRSILGKYGPHAIAAVCHDSAYIHHKRLRDGLGPIMFQWNTDNQAYVPMWGALSKEDSDRLFYDGMRAVGPLMKRYQVDGAYWAVKNFGGPYFNGELGRAHFLPGLSQETDPAPGTEGFRGEMIYV